MKKCVRIVGSIENNTKILNYLRNIGIDLKKADYDVVYSQILRENNNVTIVKHKDIHSYELLEPEKIIVNIFVPGNFHDLAFQMCEFRKYEKSDKTRVPIILIDISYWQPILEQFRKAFIEGFSSKDFSKEIHLLNIGDEEALRECIFMNNYISI